MNPFLTDFGWQEKRLIYFADEAPSGNNTATTETPKNIAELAKVAADTVAQKEQLTRAIRDNALKRLGEYYNNKTTEVVTMTQADLDSFKKDIEDSLNRPNNGVSRGQFDPLEQALVMNRINRELAKATQKHDNPEKNLQGKQPELKTTAELKADLEKHSAILGEIGKLSDGTKIKDVQFPETASATATKMLTEHKTKIEQLIAKAGSLGIDQAELGNILPLAISYGLAKQGVGKEESGMLNSITNSVANFIGGDALGNRIKEMDSKLDLIATAIKPGKAVYFQENGNGVDMSTLTAVLNQLDSSSDTELVSGGKINTKNILLYLGGHELPAINKHIDALESKLITETKLYLQDNPDKNIENGLQNAEKNRQKRENLLEACKQDPDSINELAKRLKDQMADKDYLGALITMLSLAFSMLSKLTGDLWTRVKNEHPEIKKIAAKLPFVGDGIQKEIDEENTNAVDKKLAIKLETAQNGMNKNTVEALQKSDLTMQDFKNNSENLKAFCSTNNIADNNTDFNKFMTEVVTGYEDNNKTQKVWDYLLSKEKNETK